VTETILSIQGAPDGAGACFRALARDVARLLAELDTPGAKLPDPGRLKL
jgi:hypothetical protein